MDGFGGGPEGEEEAEEGSLGKLALDSFATDQLGEDRAPGEIGESKATVFRLLQSIGHVADLWSKPVCGEVHEKQHFRRREM